jgi:DNA-binding transcriptional MerR regulator
MFKITEFSKITGLTIRTLQYYDEIGLLIPNREKNDHRTYSYNDLVIVNEIILLKDMGFKLEAIAEHVSSKNQTDLKKSLLLQKKILSDKIQEIQKQLEKINWLIQSGENSQTLEETAIKKVFIDNNPLKDKAPLIWELDFNDVRSFQYFKNYTNEIQFDSYFIKLSKFQNLPVSDLQVQTEITEFVLHLKENYGDSFGSDSISTLATFSHVFQGSARIVQAVRS